MTLELGLVSPVVTRLPRAHGPWEAAATVDDLVRVARAADASGYHHLTCAEHVAVPASAAPTRGATYWDPVATLGFLAAVTERIRLVPSVVVVGYHHPLEVVKAYGTLDRLSGGRLTLGVGVGSLAEEFDLVGAPFADRGARADDALRAIRSAWAAAPGVTSYAGEFHRWDEMVVDPGPVQERVPIWVGGRTARSLRRAVELGDGWCPFGLSPDELAALVRRASGTPAWAARDRPLDLVLQSPRAFDPLARPDEARRQLDALVAAGATHVAARLVSTSVDHAIEQAGALAALARA